jgi:hypothetical protein
MAQRKRERIAMFCQRLSEDKRKQNAIARTRCIQIMITRDDLPLMVRCIKIDSFCVQLTGLLTMWIDPFALMRLVRACEKLIFLCFARDRSLRIYSRSSPVNLKLKSLIK